MKTSLAAAALTAVVTSTLPQAHAMGDYDPEVLKVTGDQLEYRFHDDEKTQVFEGDITYGNSFDKFRLKADAERHEGETEEEHDEHAGDPDHEEEEAALQMDLKTLQT